MLDLELIAVYGGKEGHEDLMNTEIKSYWLRKYEVWSCNSTILSVIPDWTLSLYRQYVP